MTTKSSTTTSSSAYTTTSACVLTPYSQCGGNAYKGCTTCPADYECIAAIPDYYQCQLKSDY
ncbi:hypothetical protein M408DRAFT_126307 [Serendipita vermifera MAFF 305830]|uniref:CBM1 domain-containing protein n=1 Tax=Serendipita vermifera MAFF 305830 TaxID=933852 RepID=A0A0C3BC12_SERVB|nr:hypothetical protein M408DRAFT_126307 [Serendipita vermifera MAFF 305830]